MADFKDNGPAVLGLRLTDSLDAGRGPNLVGLLILHDPAAVQLFNYIWAHQQKVYGTFNGADEPIGYNPVEEEVQAYQVRFPTGQGFNAVEVALCQDLAYKSFFGPNGQIIQGRSKLLDPFILSSLDVTAKAQQPLDFMPLELAESYIKDYEYLRTVKGNRSFAVASIVIIPFGAKLILKTQDDYDDQWLESPIISNTTMRAAEQYLGYVPLNAALLNLPTTQVLLEDLEVKAVVEKYEAQHPGQTILDALRVAKLVDAAPLAEGVHLPFTYAGIPFTPVGCLPERDSEHFALANLSTTKGELFRGSWNLRDFGRASLQAGYGEYDVFTTPSGKLFMPGTESMELFTGDVNLLVAPE